MQRIEFDQKKFREFRKVLVPVNAIIEIFDEKLPILRWG